MTTPTKESETPLGATELQALRRLAEPRSGLAIPKAGELWSSRYRVLEPLGRGGMGDVFLARDVLLDRLVALKVLRGSSDEAFDERRLLREARTAARAEHERIARIYDAGTWSERAFIAMEYVRGETLRAWMRRYRPTVTEVVAILRQLLDGLGVLHERGLVHRDLKPENVMVNTGGELKILDLGIARRASLAGPSSETGEMSATLTLGFGVGTPGYMAPEQWRGETVDRRADIFALGVIAYELFVGALPFRGSTHQEVRDRTLRGELPFDEPEMAMVPAALKDAIRTALRPERAQRFASVSDMAEAMASLLRGAPTPPISLLRAPALRAPIEERGRHETLAPSVMSPSIRGPARRMRHALGVLGGAMMVGACSMGLWLGRDAWRAHLPFGNVWASTPRELVPADARFAHLAQGGTEAEIGDALYRRARMFQASRMTIIAEDAARECLAMRRRHQPDDWKAFEARGLVGSILLDERRYVDAEPHLLASYQGMTSRYDQIPAEGRRELRAVMRALVALYSAVGPAEKAIDWQQQLVAFDESNPGAAE